MNEIISYEKKIFNVKETVNIFNDKVQQIFNNFQINENIHNDIHDNNNNDNDNDNDKIEIFEKINNLFDLLIDYCLKLNIKKIHEIYNSYGEFIQLVKEDLLHFMISKINIDHIYENNIELFDKYYKSKNNKNQDDQNSCQININDYGTIMTGLSNDSKQTNMTNLTNITNNVNKLNDENFKNKISEKIINHKFKKECAKIGVFFYIIKKQNKIKLLSNKIESLCVSIIDT